MKKKFLPGSFIEQDSGRKQIYRVMKLTTCSLFLCSCFAFSSQVSSQNAKVSLNRNQVQLKEVLNDIESQTEYLFVSNRNIDLTRRVSVSANKKSVRDVLNKVLDNTGLSFKVEGVNIILSERKEADNAEGKEAFQQDQKKITGTIVDQNGEPIIGASVKVENSTVGTITDLDGKFSLNASPKATLIISFVGCKPQRVVVGREKSFSIVLEEDTKALDEVVVIGYGTTSKRKTTSAISTVDAESLAKTPASNITQSLAGRAPGLIVNTSGGGLGKMATVSIRGGGTPLVVIDDVISEYRDFENLNSEDIDQMTLLKDASATAVYGSRAANGILMIVTKKGVAGKMSVNYNFNYNISQLSNMPKKLSSYDVVSSINQAQRNDGQREIYTPEEVEKFRTGSDPYNYPNTDWHKITLRDFAPETKHSLSISGGSEKLKVFTGLSYYDQESIYKFDVHNLQRYNLRTNLVADFKEIGLKVVTGIDGFISDRIEPSTHFGTGYYYTFGHIQNKKPMQLAYNQYGQIFQLGDHPLAELSPLAGYRKNKSSSVNANFSVEWAVPFVTGLKLKSLGHYNVYNGRTKQWTKTPIMYSLDGVPAEPSKPSLSKYIDSFNSYTTQFFASYDRVFNEVHTVGAMVGVEASKYSYDNSWLSREQYLLDVDQINAGPVATAKNGSEEDTSARAGLISRLKYDYASKYIAEVSLRYDGSDNFPKGKRWGVFYAGSLAYVLSEEKFWQNLKDRHIFDQFKIRGTYGEIGLDDVKRYSYLSSYNLSERGYLVDGKFVPGFSEGDLPSKDISWYTSKNMSVGFDFASLNSRLSGSIDYFRMSTTGYLASPSNVGYTAPLGTSLPKIKTNGESIRQGAEFILQWKEKIGDFSYGVSANLTYFDSYWNINPNESEVDLKNPYKRSTQAKGYWGIGYTTLGFYQSQEDIMNSPKRPGSVNLGAGDLKYEDFNGDGIIDGADQHRIGKNGFPRANYGINIDLSYKGWFFNMLWQGATSRDLYPGDVLQGKTSGGIVYGFQKDTWSPDNKNALYPRLRSSANYNGNNNYANADFWLINAAYIRLKNMNFGYDFKHKLLKKVSWMSKCSLAFSGYNLLTFSPSTKYGMDPEVGSSNLYDYPISRTYSLSLNIGF